MIVNDCYVKRITRLPLEYDAPVIVDANRVVPPPLALQCHQPVAGRDSQIRKFSGIVQIKNLARRRPNEISRKCANSFRPPIKEQVFREPIAERFDHFDMLSDFDNCHNKNSRWGRTVSLIASYFMRGMPPTTPCLQCDELHTEVERVTCALVTWDSDATDPTITTLTQERIGHRIQHGACRQAQHTDKPRQRKPHSRSPAEQPAPFRATIPLKATKNHGKLTEGLSRLPNSSAPFTISQFVNPGIVTPCRPIVYSMRWHRALDGRSSPISPRRS